MNSNSTVLKINALNASQTTTFNQYFFLSIFLFSSYCNIYLRDIQIEEFQTFFLA